MFLTYRNDQYLEYIVVGPKWLRLELQLRAAHDGATWSPCLSLFSPGQFRWTIFGKLE